jgi:hypothetical protein
MRRRLHVRCAIDIIPARHSFIEANPFLLLLRSPLLASPFTAATPRAPSSCRLRKTHPLWAACPWLPPAQLPPPRGPLRHPAPHLLLRQHQQSPAEALTGVVLRSATYRHGAAPVVSLPPPRRLKSSVHPAGNLPDPPPPPVSLSVGRISPASRRRRGRNPLPYFPGWAEMAEGVGPFWSSRPSSAVDWAQVHSNFS